MSKQYPGGIISKTPVTPSGPYETSTASGIWTLDQQAYWQKLGQWPTAGNFPKDAQFNYVTMLLHGDGTNGAQNNTFIDSSTNNFTITRNGNTTQGSFSPYGSNWSNFFDGSGDYLATSSTQIIPATTTYTVEAWVYLTGDYSDYREIVTQGSSGNANRWLMYVNITDGKLGIQTGASGITTSFTVPQNTWTHLAFVNNSSSYTVYANGTSVGSGTNTVTPQNTYVTVGAFQSGAEYFQGYISNVRITNTAVYTSAFTPSTTPLTAISGTSFLTCQSNRFIDNSTNAYAITAYGNSSVQRFNPFGTATAYSTSVIGGSGYFDGSGDYLTTPNVTALNLGNTFTIEAWVYLSSTSVMQLVSCRDSSAGGCWQFVLNWNSGQSNGALAFKFEDGNVPVGTSSDVVKRNAWSHVAVCRNGTSFELFCNGIRVATGTNSTTFPTPSSAVFIGSLNNPVDEQLNGYMCDLRLLKNTALYSGTTYTVPTAPLTAITNTSLLTNYTNGAIFDNAMMNNLETLGNSQISTSVVKYGTGSLAFDGTGDWMLSVASQNIGFRTGDFTVEFWIYPSNWTNTYIGVIAGIVVNALWIGKNGSNFVLRAANNTDLVSYGTMPTTGTWTHIAVTRSGTTARMFYAGIQVASATTGNDFPDAAFYLGQDSGGNAFTGYLDDFRITKGYARYTANFTPPTEAFLNIGPN